MSVGAFEEMFPMFDTGAVKITSVVNGKKSTVESLNLWIFFSFELKECLEIFSVHRLRGELVNLKELLKLVSQFTYT